MDRNFRTPMAEGRYGGGPQYTPVDQADQAARIEPLRAQVLELNKLIIDANKAVAEGATNWEKARIASVAKLADMQAKRAAIARSGNKLELEVADRLIDLHKEYAGQLDARNDPNIVKAINDDMLPKLQARIEKGGKRPSPEDFKEVAAELVAEVQSQASIVGAGNPIARVAAVDAASRAIGQYAQQYASDPSLSDEQRSVYLQAAAKAQGGLNSIVTADRKAEAVVRGNAEVLKNKTMELLDQTLAGGGGGGAARSPELDAIIKTASAAPTMTDPWGTMEGGSPGEIAELKRQRTEAQQGIKAIEAETGEWDQTTKLIKMYKDKLGPAFDTFVAAMRFPGDQRTADQRAIAFFGQQPDTLKSLYNITQNDPMVAQSVDVMRDTLKKQLGVRTDPIVRSLVKDVSRQNRDPGRGYIPDGITPPPVAAKVTGVPEPAAAASSYSKVYNDGGGYSYRKNDDGTITMLTAPGKTGETVLKPGDKGFDAIQGFIDEQDAKGSTGLDASVWQKSKERAEAERQKKLADLARKAEPQVSMQPDYGTSEQEDPYATSMQEPERPRIPRPAMPIPR